MALLILDKVDDRTMNITRNKDRHFIIIKWVVNFQEVVIV